MKKGITPIIAVIILLLITVALAGLAWTFLSGYFSGMTAKSIQMIDYSCVGSNARVVIRNSGTSSINISGGATCSASGSTSNSLSCGDLTIVKSTGGNIIQGAGFPASTVIAVGSTAAFNDSCGATTCTYRFTTTTGAGGPSPNVATINC